jgi:hypothetical protein
VFLAAAAQVALPASELDAAPAAPLAEREHVAVAEAL